MSLEYVPEECSATKTARGSVVQVLTRRSLAHFALVWGGKAGQWWHHEDVTEIRTHHLQIRPLLSEAIDTEISLDWGLP